MKSLVLSLILELGAWYIVGRGSSSILIHQSNFAYQGAFNLPCNPTDSSNSCTPNVFDGLYHFGAIAFNPANNSLFVSGVVKGQIAEVSIPTLVNSSDYTTLNRASWIQGLVEATGGLIYTTEIETGNHANVGGLLVKGTKLYGTVYGFYDAEYSQTHSHFSSDLTLNSNLAGPFALSGTPYTGLPIIGYTSAYMAEIPTTWQSALGGTDLVGNACIPIISRTSAGPGVWSTNLTNIASSPPAYQLIGYDPTHYLDAPYGTGGVHTTYNGTCGITGILFPPNTASVIFFGKIGTGPYCYGQGNAPTTMDNGGNDPMTGEKWCYDPTATGEKGDHAYPYIYKVWAVDANDLAKVKAGTKHPYDLLPYDEWAMTFPSVSGQQEVLGVTYDKVTGRIFMMQQFADGGNKPTVHVFKLQ